MPDEPPQLFLSYGVRDASEIAKRLHRDLTARGYQVWQDVSRLRAGRPWDEDVPEGLRTSQVVLALLSPQSVRRTLDAGNPTATDSVCLDEIAYARDPCHIPIVPVKVMSCEAPFLLNRLHQIDFRRWNESEPVYQAGLDQIYEAIEAARRGEKRERTWGWLPKPWDFEPFLREKRKDFVGREWLFAEIDGWQVRGAQPALLITGEPGIGKSAIVAALIHENPGGQVLAYHCCQADTPATLHPASFVRNLSAMLSGRLDDYAAMLEDPAIVKVLEEADEDPASAFEAAILAPLHQLREPAPTGRYLLIDALDEALARTKGQTIVDLLSSRINRLPPWFRIVATTRNEQNVLNQLRGLTARELDAHDEQNLSDVRRFIAGRLTVATLQSAVIADGRSGEVLTEKLLTASSGNFLYVTMALKAVERGQLDFKTIELLPPGLSGMYKEFFDRLFAKAGVEFRQTRDVLEIVVDAREPLQLAEIARATGLDEDYDLPPVLDRLAPFLPAREFRYALFHKSLSDWLTGKDAKTGRKEAGAYHVSLTKGRTRLADWCWAECQHGITKDHLYCLRHLPTHLAEVGRDDDLRTLLLNFNWLQTKVETTGVVSLIADYDYLPEDKDLQLVQSAIRLSAHVLARDARQLAGQLTGRLLSNTSPSIQAFLKQASERKPWTWLGPLTPSLTPPGALIRVLAGHTGIVTAVAVTLDGHRAVSGSYDQTLQVWELERGQILSTLAGHTRIVRAVAVTADGHRVVSGSDDRTLRVWELSSGQTLCTLQGHMSGVWAVAVTLDGHRAVSGSEDGTLRLWDLESGQSLRTLEGHTGIVEAVVVTPDGCRALSASRDRTLRLWDLGTGQILRTLQGHTGPINTVAVTPDGRHAVSGSDDHTMRLWDLDSGQTVCRLEHPVRDINVVVKTGEITTVAVTPDGRRVVSGSDDHTLRLWDLESGQMLRTLEGHTLHVNAVAVTPDGRRAVSASSDRTLRVWNLESDQPVNTLEDRTGEVTVVVVTPDGRRAVSASSDGPLWVWDLERRQTVCRLEGHWGIVTAVAVTPDGCRAISGASDGTLRVWGLESGQALRILDHYTGPVNAVAVTPDGRRVLSASELVMLVWDLESGRTVCRLEGHWGAVQAVIITPDGRLAVSGGSYDRMLRVWDLKSGQTLRTLAGHTDWITGVAVTPDGRCAVSASRDKTLRVWDLESGQSFVTLEGHTGRVEAVTVTPDGRRAVSASEDGTLRLWDLESGEKIAAFTGDGGMKSCAVAPDRRTIIAGDASGRVHFLHLFEADPTKPTISDTKIPDT